MRILLSLFVCCFLTAFSAQAQLLQCTNSIFINGDLENGTPTASHQDIGNAVGFSRIWAPGSWADYYTATAGPFTPPTPADGNYASCWIANFQNGGITYREGFKAELSLTVPPNTGVYNLTFETACLGGWGDSEIAVYALHNPSGGDAPNAPTGAFTPSNTALFPVGTTQLIGIIPVTATSCSNTKISHSLNINTAAAGFPAGGMTHIFITHSDNNGINGALFMGFDNFCLPTPRGQACPASWVVNGDLEDGTPTTSHQDIHLATGFDRIWNGPGLSYADYYPATYAPAGFPTPAPPSGDYAACWIANYAGGGTTYREGFQGSLVATIPASTGTYQLSFDIACLGGWGDSEIAVYGINNASGGYGANPTGAFTPDNISLFGAANTVLLGTIPVGASNCSSTRSTQTVLIDSDASGFPASGMTHFFITHSDNSAINGARFMGFDNFCLQSFETPPCPDIISGTAECSTNGYAYTITTSNATGSVVLSSPCGTFSPSLINLTGATSYTVTFTPNGTCGNNITVNYNVGDSDGTDCDQGVLQTNLPNCNGCECDESFYQDVEQLFAYYENCPNDVVQPYALQEDCDRVDWTIDGNYIGSTTGNDPMSFPHLDHPAEVCMTVTRTTASGKECTHRVCRWLEPTFLCDPDQNTSSARLNVVPNPASSQIMVTWDGYDMPDQLTIGIFNSSGVPVKLLHNINSFDSNTRLDISTLPTGLYYIKIEGEGYSPAPVKFIKK